MTTALLERTPAALDALLRGLPEAAVRGNEGGESWSPYEIVQHLNFGERTDWMPRVRILLEHGAGRAFDAFDMAGHRREGAELSLGQQLDRFAERRAANLAELCALNLQAADLARPGRHPGLGPVTLGQLLATWAAHDLTHLHQLARVLAHPYREAVGPWQPYLGVLQCQGHGGR